jgi:tetratricopeptide (TPR) repeat protein
MSGEEGRGLLKEAVEAYRLALEVRTRDQLPQKWAMMQNNLGNALREQAIRASGEEGRRLMKEAVEAYRLALEVRTRDQLPQEWVQTEKNLAIAYSDQRDWQNAAECYANVLKAFPYLKDAHINATYFYHERVFDFGKAFELNQSWIKDHANDLLAQCSFAESHFTTSRFRECQIKLLALLGNPKIEPHVGIVLRAIAIANLAALGEIGAIPVQLDSLAEAIALEEKLFKVDWSFEGTKHFIGEYKPLAPYRDWLLKLFNVMKAADRDTMLTGLEDLEVEFASILREAR